MRRLPTLLLTAALLLPAAVLAQAARPNASLAQAERNAVELKQGMTPDEVQQLLGKPRRTALRSAALQWTYVWNGSGSASSSSERSLSVDFAAKAADQWIVNGWSWGSY
jgi:outer membrane protein assembly factor BamE (lipoprotein component of BamABCDE complex)